MLRPRITPCLLVHDGGLVKTTLFDEPKYVGDPINAVKIFNEKETDELIVLDIDASVRNAEPNFKVIRRRGQNSGASKTDCGVGGGKSRYERSRNTGAETHLRGCP